MVFIHLLVIINQARKWNIVNSYPDLFAAAVPISCPQPSGNKVINFINTPIKAFSGTNGSAESYYNNEMTSFVKKINDAGGKAEKVTHNGHSHSTILKSIDYDELFAWMLSQ